MNWTLGSLVGLLAGLAGAAIWAAAAYYTGWEMGYLAWAIGLGVGVAVHRTAIRRSESSASGSASAAVGLLAMVLTLVAVLGGKLGSSVLLAERAAARGVLAAEGDLLCLEDPERVISYLADDAVLRHIERGEEIAWPEEVDPLFAAAEGDYPVEIWSEAAALWEELDAAARQRFIDDIRASSSQALPELVQCSAWQTFRLGFGSIDLLFFALALVTAFKGGGGKIA